MIFKASASARIWLRPLFLLFAVIAGALPAVAAEAEQIQLQIEKAEVSFGPELALNLQLTPKSAKELDDFLTIYVRKTVDLEINGIVISHPTIREPINGTSVQLVLTGDMQRPDAPGADSLVRFLTLGKAKVVLRQKK